MNGEPSLIAIIVATIFLKAQHGLILKKWIFRSGFCQIFHSFFHCVFLFQCTIAGGLCTYIYAVPIARHNRARGWGLGTWGPKTAATLNIRPTQNNSWRKQTQLSWQQQPCACVPRRAWNESCRRLLEVLQSRRRHLLGPSPGWKHLLALPHLRHY